MKKWLVLLAKLLFLLTPILTTGCTINLPRGINLYFGPHYGGFIKIYNNAGPNITITPFSEGDGFLKRDSEETISLKFGEKLEIPFYINHNNSTVYIPLGLKVYKNGEFIGFYFYNPITVEPWAWRQKEKIITLVFGKRELRYLQSSGDKYHEWHRKNY